MICLVVVIGLAARASIPATTSDVPGVTCVEIGSFARQIAAHKAEGASMDETIRRLRASLGVQDADTERELEDIVRAIYRTPIFSTATPEEVGMAYQTACELE
jgi:phosphoribosylformylglycinamidine (FGAM) synthase-like enzyme